jgi:predicted house-cleaning noncanonical NTP pyrophosphatase (MazG superfamily)
MTDEVQAQDAPQDDTNTQTQDAQQTPEPRPSVQGDEPSSAEFQVPEAFKDKPWVSKVKSVDDVFKMYDDVQPLIGKKKIVPDHNTASTEELTEYYSSLRPEKSDAYELPDTPDKDALQSMLHDAYISPWQAKILAEKHQELSVQAAEAARSKEGYEALMKERFGDGYSEKVTEIAGTLKNILPEEKLEIVESLANEELAFVFDVVDSVLQKYGVNESSKGLSNNGKPAASGDTKDIEAQKEKIRNELVALSSKPHTIEEKQELQNQLKNLMGV